MNYEIITNSPHKANAAHKSGLLLKETPCVADITLSSTLPRNGFNFLDAVTLAFVILGDAYREPVPLLNYRVLVFN